jgi:hypothetical protein
MEWSFKNLRFENKVFFWTSVWFLFGMLLTAGILSRQQKVDVQSAYLWVFGFSLAGAIVGLVFAIPKVLSNDASLGAQQPNSAKILQENTNLFQISEWLTKTIVGAGLVEMKSIPSFVLKVAGKMAEGAAIKGDIAGARSFCAGIIVFSISFGFIVGYLITRLVINRLLADDSEV